MGMFDDIILIKSTGEIVSNEWIEWSHFSIPNKPEWFREMLRNIMAIFNHCLKCSALDGCYFYKRIMPEYPLHTNCDCDTKSINFIKVKSNAKSECDIRKFTDYVFKNNKESKGKNKIFFDLGFNINDSEYLQKEFNKQALKNYLTGNYILKNLDRRGQRIAIPISINNNTFYSGWMIYPEGKIKNTTPFGGWVK